MKVKIADNATARMDITMKQIVTKTRFVERNFPFSSFSISDCMHSALSFATKSNTVDKSLSEFTILLIMRSFLKNPALKNLQILVNNMTVKLGLWYYLPFNI